MGHSEGIMRPLMLTLGATLLVGAPARRRNSPQVAYSSDLAAYQPDLRRRTVSDVRYGIPFGARALLIANLRDA